VAFWKPKPIVALPRDQYISRILDALIEGISTDQRFTIFAETVADSARLINDIFSEEDPDDPHKLLYVDDFVFDLPISRAPEAEMYVFLTYALQVAASYCKSVLDHPLEEWVPATQQEFYPIGKLHGPEISKDVFEAFYIYGDRAMIKTERTHGISRQQLQFIVMCITYTLLAVYASETNQPTASVINKFQHDLANVDPTFIEILKLPQINQ
jgi:hypothetical protein